MQTGGAAALFAAAENDHAEVLQLLIKAMKGAIDQAEVKLLIDTHSHTYEPCVWGEKKSHTMWMHVCAYR